MKRIHMIVEGQVQGVGFRALCQKVAYQCACTGSVRNMSNGMVELFVQGEEPQLFVFKEKLFLGNRWAVVENIEEKEVPLVEGEENFQVRF